MPLIVGGGPAGSAAAIRLAWAGHHPVVIERTAEPADMLCGGFLSWNTMRLLEECGVDPLALGAHPVHRARVFAATRMADLHLPAPAAGLSRRRLDEALLNRAAQAGATVRRGVAVRAIEGGEVRLADGSVERAEHLILATGKHDVRGASRVAASPLMSIGLRWRFPASASLAARLDDAIELHLFDQGYAGLMMQEDGAANLCMAVRLSVFAEAGQTPHAMLARAMRECPALSGRIGGEAIGEAQAIANVPYGWRARDDAAGLYRVGDQIGVIPSVAGEGVGIALTTGMAAADAVMAGRDARRYQSETARRIARPIRAASGLWQAAEHPALAHNALPILSRIPGIAGAAMRWTRI